MLKHFSIGTGPDVSTEDDEITMKQYKDYIETGVYKDRKEYE